MGKTKGRVINREWVRMEIASAIVIAIGIVGILPPESDEIWVPWMGLLIGIAMFVGAFWLLPHFCYVDSEGIRITYAFGKTAEAVWQEIRGIECTTATARFNKIHPWEKEYRFIGLSGERFYMDGTFIKSRKLTRLLRACGADKLIEKE